MSQLVYSLGPGNRMFCDNSQSSFKFWNFNHCDSLHPGFQEVLQENARNLWFSCRFQRQWRTCVSTCWDTLGFVLPCWAESALSVGVCFNFAVLTSSFAPSKNKHHWWAYPASSTTRIQDGEHFSLCWTDSGSVAVGVEWRTQCWRLAHWHWCLLRTDLVYFLFIHDVCVKYDYYEDENFVRIPHLCPITQPRLSR